MFAVGGLVGVMITLVSVRMLRTVRPATDAFLTDTEAESRLLTREDFFHLHRETSDGFVLYIDLERVRAINDLWGYQAGDDALGQLTEILCDATKPYWTAALGGDDFAVLVPGPVHLAQEVADEVVERLDVPICIDGRRVSVGCSIGIAALGEMTTFDLDRRVPVLQAVRNADHAMHRARLAGGRRWVRFDESIRSEVSDERELEFAIRDALDNDELQLAYQPIYRLATLELTGFEALLRWTRPGYGHISPDKFVAAAERFGLTTQLARWVAERAIAEHGICFRARPDLHLAISINFPASELGSKSFVSTLCELTSFNGLTPLNVTIELAERTLIQNDIAIHSVMNHLRNTGFTIAIDDFGTGYSSLAYLENFPIDFVKIDRALVDRVTGEPTGVSVMSAIIDLCHALGYQVVAEGVERPEQVVGLKHLQCDSAQGYSLSRPMSHADAFQLVLSQPVRNSGGVEVSETQPATS